MSSNSAKELARIAAVSNHSITVLSPEPIPTKPPGLRWMAKCTPSKTLVPKLPKNSPKRHVEPSRDMWPVLKKLKELNFWFTVHSPHHLKVGNVNYWPSTGSIVVDGAPEACPERGLDALIRHLDRQQHKSDVKAPPEQNAIVLKFPRSDVPPAKAPPELDALAVKLVDFPPSGRPGDAAPPWSP